MKGETRGLLFKDSFSRILFPRIHFLGFVFPKNTCRIRASDGPPARGGGGPDRLVSIFRGTLISGRERSIRVTLVATSRVSRLILWRGTYSLATLAVRCGQGFGRSVNGLGRSGPTAADLIEQRHLLMNEALPRQGTLRSPVTYFSVQMLSRSDARTEVLSK
jgi:hypothetical protein